MLKYALAAALSVTALGTAATAANAAPLKLGTLTCQSKGGTGYIVASTKHLTCVFKSAGNGPNETYTGSITNIGIDIGQTGKTVVEWGVFAKNKAPEYSAGSLAGSYSGVGANASFAAGMGAHLLAGGNGGAYVLQPLSIQVQEGVNAAVGINTLTLKPAAG